MASKRKGNVHVLVHIGHWYQCIFHEYELLITVSDQYLIFTTALREFIIATMDNKYKFKLVRVIWSNLV